MTCAYSAHLVPATHQNHRGVPAMQAIASDDAAPPRNWGSSTTSWPAVTPPTALTSSRGGLGRAKPPSVSILLDGLRQGERCSSSASFCPWRTGTVGHWTAWRSTNSSRLSWASIPSSSSLIHTSALELGETVHMVLAEVGRRRPPCVVFGTAFGSRPLPRGG